MSWSVKTGVSGTIHCVASCTQCEWYNEDYLNATRKARQHVAKTGHRINVERAVHYQIYSLGQKPTRPTTDEG